MNTRLLSLRGQVKSDALSERVVFWVTNYERQLLSIAYNVLRDWPAAEDCVQESLIKAGLRINQLKSKDSEFSWLARIVVNQSKTMLRQRKARNPERLRALHAQWISSQVDTYPSIEHGYLSECVAKLPNKLKILIILHYYHDMGLPDIASTLNVKESTLRVWLHRARTKLKRMMEDKGVVFDE
ncbi:RNA polymerase sigma factor [Alicyclobacillus suci]|uniref:RNA polymerase sigma factor n=1 Tax=Alicyclobacillus suci TaxID=2816080 RepID=UPI001A8E4191|nr:RNA polymerase sigma factor [Alicyclobacillus suci]